MSKLAQWKNRKQSIRIPKLGKEVIKVASLGQARLYFIEKLYSNGRLYQYGHTYKFKEKIDQDKIQEKFQALIARHDILRSNFVEKAGQVIIETKNQVTFEFESSSLSHDDFFNLSFDLANDILIRAHLSDPYTLALSIHHIVADRESLLIINRELFNDSKDLQHIQYSDFSSYYNDKVNEEIHLQYWRQKLSGELPLLTFPYNFERPENPIFAGKTINKIIDKSTYNKLIALTKTTSSTIYNLLLAVYSILLSKYTNQSDVIIGTPISNRDSTDVQNLIGFFNETIVLRNEINPKITFHDFLEIVKTGFIEALTHKNVSFDKIISEINPVRIKGANPIFQNMFLFNNHNETFSENGELIKEIVEDLGVSKFDQTIFAIEKEGQLELKLEYSTELFEDSTAERFLNDFASLLNNITDNLEVKIGELEIVVDQCLNPPEKLILAQGQSSIIEKIDFTRTEIAIVSNGNKISFQDLDKRSNDLATKLLERGLLPNEFVGLHSSRSIEMIIGILGILKAGGAYLPLDPNYPFERVSHMIEDSGTRIIVYSEALTIEGIIKIDLKKIKKSSSHSNFPMPDYDSLAYMIYTSGSTGRPKGVPISHRNLLHSTEARFKFYPSQPKSFLLLSSMSFDSSVAGIFWTLCAGGKLVLPPERIEQDVEQLSEIISENKVTHTLLLPSLYQVLLELSDSSMLSTLKNVMVAGEACNQSVSKIHFSKLPNTLLFNEYGPTEATVWCIAHEITSSDTRQIPIGRPIPYYQSFILNSDLSMTVQGGIGELYISGPGLSKGYWKNVELTDQKFIDHHKFGRLYKTGDLAKTNRKNEILFLGRADSQVKIRGHRVELDEIKNQLLRIPEISEAEVIYNERLIAFVNGKVSRPLLLPDYMVPSQIIELEYLPKLPNGKTDRSKLIIPVQVENKSPQASPKSDTEIQLMAIWKKVLNNDRININDNFFEIGGDSLLSIQIVAKARDAGIKLHPTQLFEFQNIKSLAKSIDKNEDESDVLVTFNSKGSSTPLFCIHSGGAHVLFYKKFASYISKDIPIYSFQPKGLDGNAEMAKSIEEIASHYIEEMKKVQAHGPYQILGTCFSNAVALEMAHQLSENGDKIDHLFIIDSAPVHLFGNELGKEKQTIRRFVDMALRGDFKRIKSKIKSRIFKSKEWESNIKTAIEADAVLDKTIKNLNKMYADYHWKPYNGRINLIRSTEFNGRKDKSFHISQWNKLAKGGLDISIVHGHHLTLFEEPEVSILAHEVETLMAETLHEYA